MLKSKISLLLQNTKAKIAVAVMLLVTIISATVTGVFFTQKNKANQASSQLANYDLTSVEILSKAAELLGRSYYGGTGSGLNGKGYNGPVWNQNVAYNPDLLLPASAINANSATNKGVDCSGLIYWTLASLMKEKGLTGTQGFSYNHPVPVDTFHWLVNGNGAAITKDSLTTFNGKRITILKANEPITASLRYYQYIDANGNVANIPSGTIIISEGKKVNSNGQNHAWIYIGDLGTSDANVAYNKMVNEMGLKNINAQFVRSTGTSTHWRIESSGGNGVIIDNTDPNQGYNEAGKVVGNIWAFQLANVPEPVKPEGMYSIQIVKVDENGNKITADTAEFNVNGHTIKSVNGVAAVDNTRKIEDENMRHYFKITETKAPQGYERYTGEINVDVGFKIDESGKKYIINANGTKVTAPGMDGKTYEITPDGMHLTVYVQNKKIQNGQYSVELYKVDNNGKIIAEPVSFDVNGEKATTNQGVVKIATNKVMNNDTQVDTYTIKETNAPAEYKMFNGTVNLKVKMTKTDKGLELKENGIDFKVDGDTSSASFKLEGSTIKVFVKNTKKIFDLSLRKYISKINGKDVEPSRAPVINEESIKVLEQTGTALYHHAKNSLMVATGDEVEYTIRVYNEGEILGYAKEITDYLPEGLTFVRMAEGNSSEYSTQTQAGSKVVVINYSGNTAIKSLRDFIGKKVEINGGYYQEVKIICKVETSSVKYITSRAEITNYGYNTIDASGNAMWAEARVENVDIDSVEKTIASNLELNTWYENAKTYTYKDSEGKDVNVSDYYPGAQDDDDFETVEVMSGNYNIIIKKVDSSNKEQGLEGANFDVTIGEVKKTVVTDKNGMVTVGDQGIKSVNDKTTITIKETKAPADYKAYNNEIKINTAMKSVNGVYVLDKDNTKLAGEYKAVTMEVNEEGTVITITIPNDKKALDLSLRKFITEVNGIKPATSREPQVDISKLASGESTTATYKHPKDVVGVNTGDVVTYTIRVYNEGEIDGYAARIMDDIPEGLEFLPEESINKEYKWVLYKEAKDGEDSKNTITYNDKKYVVTENVKEADVMVTDYLAKDKDAKNLIPAFDGKTLNYKDVKVAFKVIAPSTSKDVITNYAQITKHTDRNGDETIVDRDSTPNKWVDGEDDQDIEKIRVKYFDLALRKFITEINGKKLKTSREPQVDVSKLASGESTTATYTHPKDTVDVNTTDVVTYTIRVYNESEVAGYATRIMDDIPQGLEFLPDEKVNKEYKWVLYKEVKDGEKVDSKNTITYNDKKYVVTENVKEADVMVTDYLAKDKDAKNLIAAFDGKKLDYRDVKVAFKVVEPTTSDRVITNYAQITKHTDYTGNTTIIDRDSTPNKWIDGEDDQDIESVKVRYFDLALIKYVSKAIVYENGTKNIIETGHTGLERPEPVVKVDLQKANIDKVKVKFEYTIKIKNEGQIPGYAKEISDYVPEGLKFVAEDNKNWKEVDGKIVTDALKDKLLNPGETAEVTVILTWINNKDNLGLKTNIAEISKDYNEYGTPDIDSTPNNKVPGEDDIDDAPVMLAIRTGMPKQYIGLVLGFLVVITASVVVIKKKVLTK